jgi:hypothetical protein
VDEQSGSGRIRASDAERERVARFLATAFTDGRLDLAEYDARVAAAYAAVYRDELTALLDELPAPDRPLFDPKPVDPKPVDPKPVDPTPAAPVPAPAPARPARTTPPAGVVPNGLRVGGWPVVVSMFAVALCLARLGSGPFVVLLVLIVLATALGWISDDADRRGRRTRR